MHGKSAKERAGFMAMIKKDPKAQQAAVDEYFKHWDNKDSATETAETREVAFEHVTSVETMPNKDFRSGKHNTPPSPGSK